jgi:hypothetical protein
MSAPFLQAPICSSPNTFSLSAHNSSLIAMLNSGSPERKLWDHTYGASNVA